MDNGEDDLLLLNITIDCLGVVASNIYDDEIKELDEFELDVVVVGQSDDGIYDLETTLGLSVQLRAVYSKNKNTITSIEIDDIDDYNCPYCPYYNRISRPYDFLSHRRVDMGYCTWAGMNEANRIYHDTEWGIPVHDDRRMFEHLTLECLQCGLSWDLMLKKREIFRECFDNFDYEKIALYGDADVERILNTEGMIRSLRKVQAVINNARCYRKVREEFGSFCEYIWGFSDGKTILYNGHDDGPIPVSNGLSDRISKDLKKRGFKYVGAITIYSHLQACGIINDHDRDCPCGKRIKEAYPTVRKRRDKEVK